jgi:hypothetical protein
MANRFPIIFNESAGQLQELAVNDNLDLTSSGIVNIGNIQSVGIVTATSFYGGSATITGNVSIAGTLTYEDVTNIDSIGIVTARAGIVLGPTANTIQLGTGTTISSPSSDTFTISTNGSERVRVSSSGNVGIGTASPSTEFEVLGSGTVASFKGTGGSGSIGILDADDGTVAFIVVDAGVLKFQTSGSSYSDKVRISTAGGFSVGTTADPGAGAIFATGDITAFYSSDIRLKKDIEPISEPIKKLMEISGVTYKWNEEYLKDKDVDGYFVRETEVGVIAQEVEKVLPEVVATRENGYKAVRYEKLVALLIEAVKDQQKQIDELKARLEEN